MTAILAAVTISLAALNVALWFAVCFAPVFACLVQRLRKRHADRTPDALHRMQTYARAAYRHAARRAAQTTVPRGVLEG